MDRAALPEHERRKATPAFAQFAFLGETQPTIITVQKYESSIVANASEACGTRHKAGVELRIMLTLPLLFSLADPRLTAIARPLAPGAGLIHPRDAGYHVVRGLRLFLPPGFLPNFLSLA
jgi:hypothetical protein